MFKLFIRIREHCDCRLRFAIFFDDIKVFYYYQRNTTAEMGINNSFNNNYSDIIFNRESSFKFLTRLDIKKR